MWKGEKRERLKGRKQKREREKAGSSGEKVRAITFSLKAGMQWIL